MTGSTKHAKLSGGNDGYVLFLRQRTLMAQPFDAGKAQTTGDAVPIAEQVDDWQFGSDRQGQFSASQNGILVYTSGATTGGNVQLTWFDRSGKPGGTVGTPGAIRRATISPDGATVAADRQDASALRDIWLYNLARGTASQFTFGPANNQLPLWSPDGSKIVFHSYAAETGSRTKRRRAVLGRKRFWTRTHGTTSWTTGPAMAAT